jgi:hypothetical protein
MVTTAWSELNHGAGRWRNRSSSITKLCCAASVTQYGGSPHFTVRRAYYNTNLFNPTRPPSESVLKRVPPEGSGYRGTMITHNTELSFPAPLYTLATFLLTSLGLSLPPYPYFTKNTNTHADVTDPDPSIPAGQDPDTVDIPFFTVTPVRRLVTGKLQSTTQEKGILEYFWNTVVGIHEILVQIRIRTSDK